MAQSSLSPVGDGEPWSYLGVENADLAVDAGELAKGKLRDWDSGETHEIPCGMNTLAKLFDVDSTHHLIGHLPGNEPIGAFEFHPLRDDRAPAKAPSLWLADCKTQKRLIVHPTHKGVVVRKELAARMRTKKSKLLLQKGPQWTSQALLATTEDAVLGGSVWTTLRHGDERVSKAFSLWANSILGMVVYWTRG